MEKKAKKLWYIIGICSLLIFFLIFLSSILDIGEKLRNINKYIEYGFYALVIVVLIFGILNPIRIIVTSPSLKIATTLDENDPKVYKIYKNVAKNIVKNNELKEDEKRLLTKYKSKEELLFNLQVVFDSNIKKSLNKIIIDNAKVVMISTAICQSARFDMITVFTVNLQMIKKLVQKCGYRPTMKNLSKLTVQILSTALIAEGLENLQLDDVLPSSTLNLISEIPLIKPLISSIMQGLFNALLTLRIGCVCKRYLYSDGNVVTKEEIRRLALTEAIKILPNVIAETMTFFPKRIIKFFTFGSKKVNEEEI